MAEQVQAALDQMVAPMRDLMDRHIFTEEEIRAIIDRRRESEYLLRRRAARKADFLRYIEAEMLLEKLRALRTTKRKRDHRKAQREKGIFDEDDPDQKKKRGTEDDPIGDAHIVQHIHLLFVRAIRKFRSDLSLHLQHAEFCKSVKSWTRLGRVYAEALQIFPREAGIWIEAASNEFFGPNRSVKSARVLLQRAIRLNGDSSEELWLQYFTLELHYAQTLKGRRKILHPSEGSDDDDNNNSDSDENENENVSDYNKIPMVILRNAIQSIPKNVQFRLKFLDICQQFPDTADFMEYIQASMAIDFGKEPESWIARAIYQAKKQNGTDEPEAKRARTANDGDESDEEDPVLCVLKDAIDTLNTNEMFLQAFRFAEDYRMELEQADDEFPAGSIEQVDEFIDEIWSKTKDESIKGDLSELIMEQTRYLLRQGKEDDALRTIKNYCTLKSSPSAAATAVVPSEAWLLWASLDASSLKKQTSVLKRALQSIPMDKHPDYVVVLLQYFAAQLRVASEKENENDSNHETNLFQTLQKLLLLAPKTVGNIAIEPESTGLDFEVCDVFEAYKACLNHFYEHKGISGARSIYESVLFRSNATALISEDTVDPIRGFVDRCLELEHEFGKIMSGSISTKTKAKRRTLCKLYDKAIEIFEGTPLEESYRYDRNELAVFG